MGELSGARPPASQPPAVVAETLDGAGGGSEPASRSWGCDRDEKGSTPANPLVAGVGGGGGPDRCASFGWPDEANLEPGGGGGGPSVVGPENERDRDSAPTEALADRPVPQLVQKSSSGPSSAPQAEQVVIVGSPFAPGGWQHLKVRRQLGWEESPAETEPGQPASLSRGRAAQRAAIHKIGRQGLSPLRPLGSGLARDVPRADSRDLIDEVGRGGCTR